MFQSPRELFEATTQFRVTEQQLGTRVDDGSIVLNLANGEYFKLNETALTIWEQLRERRSLDELLEHMRSVYEVDEKQCDADVKQVLRDMLEAGLIETIE